MARKPHPLRPIDRRGRLIRQGDFVRIAQLPWLRGMPAETKTVFRRSRRRVLRVHRFEENGLAELVVRRLETIYIEPGCLVVHRRSSAHRVRRMLRKDRAI